MTLFSNLPVAQEASLAVGAGQLETYVLAFCTALDGLQFSLSIEKKRRNKKWKQTEVVSKTVHTLCSKPIPGAVFRLLSNTTTSPVYTEDDPGVSIDLLRRVVLQSANKGLRLATLGQSSVYTDLVPAWASIFHDEKDKIIESPRSFFPVTKGSKVQLCRRRFVKLTARKCCSLATAECMFVLVHSPCRPGVQPWLFSFC